MNKTILLASSILVGAGLLAGQASGQGTPQTIGLIKVDTMSLATGYRASKIVGSAVVNEASDTIGKIDDVIVSPDGKAPYAVLSVGGFLGMGDRLVVVPYSALKFVGGKMVLPGASKAELKELPEFKYAKS